MAKMHRVGRAWLRLTQALETGRSKNRVCRGKSWRKQCEEHERLYQKLLFVVRDLGIKVHVQQEFEPVKDFYGRVFEPDGTWSGLSKGIRMSGEGNFFLLAHEFAHGIDEMMVGRRGAQKEKELVASCASYLFCVDYLGRGHLDHTINYPRSCWGATVDDFHRLDDYIIDVYRQMTILFAMDNN